MQLKIVAIEFHEHTTSTHHCDMDCVVLRVRLSWIFRKLPHRLLLHVNLRW